MVSSSRATTTSCPSGITWLGSHTKRRCLPFAVSLCSAATPGSRRASQAHAARGATNIFVRKESRIPDARGGLCRDMRISADEVFSFGRCSISKIDDPPARRPAGYILPVRPRRQDSGVTFPIGISAFRRPNSSLLTRHIKRRLLHRSNEQVPDIFFQGSSHR